MFEQRNLVSDIPEVARFTDKTLLDPWGVVTRVGTAWAVSATSKLIISYNISGDRISSVTVTGEPTGIVDASGTNFGVDFIVVTKQGSIETYSIGSPSTRVVVEGSEDNSFTGVAIFDGALYVANFKAGSVDVYDISYTKKTSITSDGLKLASYHPYNVYSTRGRLFISYSLYNKSIPSSGFIDVYKKDELVRIVNNGPLNAPWGMMVIKNKLYVSNNGNGLISIFDLDRSRSYCGSVKTPCCGDIINPGIRAIVNDNQTNTDWTCDKSQMILITSSLEDTHGLVAVLR